MSVQPKSYQASIQPQSTVYIQDDELEVTGYVDGILSSIGFGLFQVLAFILAGMTCIAYVCESLTLGFISIEVTKLWEINSLVYASVPSVTCLANIVGESIISYFADRYGRKWPYVVSLFVVGVCIAGSGFAPNFVAFVILRGAAAIGIGGTFVVKIPMLMEFLPVRRRGVVSISTGLIETFSQCAVAGLAWWLVPHYIRGWRYFISASSIPSLIAGLLLMFFVESPRYLVAHNKAEQAWKVFSLISFINGKDINVIIRKEEFFHQVAKLTKNEKKLTSGKFSKFLTIFKWQHIRKTVCLGIVFSIANTVPYNTSLFLPNYLKELGLNPYFILLIGITAQIPGLALIAIIVEWPEFGRLNTLRLFTFLSVVFLLLFGFVQNEIATPVFIVLVYFSLVPCLGLITTYISESYPTEIRVMALAFLTSLIAISGVWFPFVSGYTADLTKKYSWLLPTFLGGMMAIQLIFTLLLNHETRGKNLEDVLSTPSN